MSILLSLFALVLSVCAMPPDQAGPLSSRLASLQPEVLITILPPIDLQTALAAPVVTIEHKSEVARTGPVSVVVNVKTCQKDAYGTCNVNVDIVVYKPDGSVHQEVKSVTLATGRGSMALTFDAQAPSGVYRAVATIRDLTARRIATAERQFGLE